MISLAKTNCPEVLQNNAEQWTEELVSTLEADQKPTATQRNRYNQPSIKQALTTETHGKCAYCESKVRHVDDGDIEHILPKSKRPELSFEWKNLTYSCRLCNRSKGDYISEDDPQMDLINPYVDNPSEHFMFHREIITPSPASYRAMLTYEKIKLYRNDLVERRREKIDLLDGLVQNYWNAQDKFRPMIYRKIRDLCIGADKEYSAALSAYLESLEALGIFEEETA